MGIPTSASIDQVDLRAARRSLTKAAGQALTAGALNPDDIVRVRFALKRARSSRASAHALKAAARVCRALAEEFEGRSRRIIQPRRSNRNHRSQA